jgi:hypothetical protein
VVSPRAGINDLSWSYDGQWLAFERPDIGTSSVWAVRINGSGLREVASAAIISYRWSTTGDVLVIASSSAGPPYSALIRVVAVTSRAHVIDRIANGEAGPIAASGSEVAVGETLFKASVGFTRGSLLVESLTGGEAHVEVSSNALSYQPLGFSPDGSTLIYVVDPDNSASLAADGLEIHVRGSTGDQVLGVALVDPGSWSWSSDSADLAITLGDSRAAWATDKHVSVCAVLLAHCRRLQSPPGTISFDPSYGTAGRFAYVTAAGLGGASGFGRGSPSGSAVDSWESTFRVLISNGSAVARELSTLGAADDPQWVAGGPGLLVERSGALCYLKSISSPPACFTPRFLALGFGNYGQFDWRGSFALAPH